MLVALILAIAVAAVALLALAMVWVDRRHLAVEAARLRAEVDLSRAAVASRDAEITGFREQVAALGEKLRGQQQWQSELETRFKTLSVEVFKASKEDLLQLAAERFKGERKEVESLVKPIGESLEKFNKLVQQTEQSRKQDQGALDGQITRLSRETALLVRALRRPESRGRWGELQLRRVVELAGMADHIDFQEQVSFDGMDGRLRPDMIVHLPNARRIVIDAKAVMDAYLDAVEADDEQTRAGCLDRHVRQIESRVRDLAAKSYFEQVGAPDFVVLFLPGEAFLYAAMQRKADLMEAAIAQGVVIATPSTLVALLKAVALGWREEQIAENARRISELGRELHSRLATAFGHLASLGRRLERTTEAYNKLVGSVDRQLVPAARRFEELGVQSGKELPDVIPAVEILPRQSSLIADPDTPADATPPPSIPI